MARFLKEGQIQNEGRWNTIRYPWYFDFPSHGGLVCSPAGFVTFIQDLISEHPVLLKPETIKEFFRPQNDKFAITWQIAGEGIFKHSGGGIGYATEVRIYKDKNIATLFFANISDTRRVGKTMDTLDAIFIR